jgi:hypothetical protein
MVSLGKGPRLPPITASSRPARYRRSRRSACSSSPKRFAEPHGQRSFRPSFRGSSLSPWTTRNPRRTFVSDGYPTPAPTARLERRGGSRIRRGAPCRASSQRQRPQACGSLPGHSARAGECRREGRVRPGERCVAKRPALLDSASDDHEGVLAGYDRRDSPVLSDWTPVPTSGGRGEQTGWTSWAWRT